MVGDDVLHSRETTDAARLGARPLVLLHGVATTSRYFVPLLRALEGRAPAAAVDLPGVGPGRASRLPATIAEQADVVAAWCRATDRRPAAVVGNSMGAQTAVELAVRHPGLAPRLVLIGPTVDAAARAVVPQIGRLLVDATIERPSLLAITAADRFRTRQRAVLRYLRASLAHRVEERVARVPVPVLVIRGARDPVAPRRWAREVASAAPRGRLVEVPGGSHACHHGRPRAVADLLTRAPGGAG